MFSPQNVHRGGERLPGLVAASSDESASLEHLVRDQGVCLVHSLASLLESAQVKTAGVDPY